MALQVEFNGKIYPLVYRLTYREGLEIEDHLSDLLDIDERLKSGKQEQLNEVMNKVKSIKPIQRRIILNTLTKSLGKEEDEVYSMTYAEVIMLFLKVWKANSEIPDFLERR